MIGARAGLSHAYEAPAIATTAARPTPIQRAIVFSFGSGSAARGGFQRLPTAPVDLRFETAPAEPGTEDAPVAQWLMPEPAPPRRGLAAWALVFSIGGLVASLFVGWGFPIGLVGVISAILALRRPLESRAVAIWALVLGIISVLFSAGWLLFAASRANLLG